MALELTYTRLQRQSSRPSVTTLKARGDVVGQEFGLVRCPSNVGTPVPIPTDGQPLPLP
jgi:hypothetical protein